MIINTRYLINYSLTNDNWCVGNSDGGSVDNRGSMNSVDKRGSVNNRGSVDNWSSDSLDHSSGDSDSWSVLGGSSVGDILDDSVSVVGVGHGLNSAVGEVDGVAAGGGVSVPLLGLGEVGSRVVISNSVVVSVDWRLAEVINISWSSLGHENSSWESSGDTEESSSDESLENMNMLGLKNIDCEEHSPSWLRSVCCKSYSE